MLFFLKRGACVCAAGRSGRRSSRRERDGTVFIRTEFAAAATRIPPNLPRHPCASLQHAVLLAYCQVCLMSTLHGTAWVTPSCPARANRNHLGVKAKFSNFLSSLTSNWWRLCSLGSGLQSPGLPKSHSWTHQQYCLVIRRDSNIPENIHLEFGGEICNISEIKYHNMSYQNRRLRTQMWIAVGYFNSVNMRIYCDIPCGDEIIVELWFTNDVYIMA